MVVITARIIIIIIIITIIVIMLFYQIFIYIEFKKMRKGTFRLIKVCPPDELNIK